MKQKEVVSKVNEEVRTRPSIIGHGNGLYQTRGYTEF